MPLIPIAALAKVWPKEYEDPESTDGCEADSAQYTRSIAQATTRPTEIDALRKQSALSTEDLARLTTALKGALDPDGIVDLSRFPLTADQILSILKKLPNFKRLDVSHCQAVDRGVFLHLLKTYDHLRWINVLHCPISGDDLKDLATDNPRRFRSIEAILHPTFLQIPASFPVAFSLAHISRTSWEPTNRVALPFFVADQLVQNLFDFCSNINSYATPHSSVLASLHRSPDQSWQDRVIPYLPESDSGWGLKKFRVGYQFVILNGEQKYGILPPPASQESKYTDSDIIGVEAFLKSLEEEGSWATDARAVKRLLELLAGMALLTAKDIEVFEQPMGEC